MSTAPRLLSVVALACITVISCGSHPAAHPNATGSRSTASPISSTAPAPDSAARTAISPAATTSGAPDCVGLSICTPPPPDAEGNPACFYSDGWQANSGGPGIEIWYFHEPQNLSRPDKVTAVVRKKDGTDESQEAAIEAGQQTHRFEFPTIDKSVVQEVLLSNSTGRCFVIGPGS